MTQRSINLFSNGLTQDVAPHQQPPGTYRHARNLRLLNNTDPAGSAEEGRSLALEVLAGTERAWCLTTGYTSIGEIDTDMGLVVFSHNGANSEIGLVDPDSDGIFIKPANAYRPDGYRYSYFTLYNDLHDPNGDKLELPSASHLQLTTTQENNLITRVYWAVGNKNLRVLNLRLCIDKGQQYYHDEIVNGVRLTYPRHLSVHQMDVLPDVDFGTLDYQRRIDGTLLSGGYQLTYRYRSLDGHASPFAPINSRPYFVSDKQIPTNPEISHHARYMGSSGVATLDGMRFILNGVDLRWDTLEVAVLYHRAGVGVERALITHRIALSTNPQDSASLAIELTNFTGTSINTAEFLTQQQNIESVQTVASANNQLYVGGVKLASALMVDASKVTHGFVSQEFRADQTLAPTFKEKINPENPYRKDGDKLTNTQPETVTRHTGLYETAIGTVVSRSLDIYNDYNHNKGVQVATNLAGYRRGETYPFSAVCLDTKGIPYFAVPLGDITFPDWAESPPIKRRDITIPILGSFSLTLPVYSTAHLGAKFDGIRLPVSMVYDAGGKRRLGSIMIARGEASGRVGFQAVALNCCVTQPENSTTLASDQGYKKIEPHPSWNNGFKLPNSGIGGGPSHYGCHHTKSTNTNIKNQGAILEVSWKGRTDDPMPTLNKAYWVQLHAPDVLTTGVLPDLSADPSARLQMLGAAHGSSGNEIRMAIAEGLDFPRVNGGPLHIYTKNYKTNGQLLAGGDANGRPKLGAKSRIKTWFRHSKAGAEPTYAGIDPENDKLFFDAQQSIMTQYREGGFANTTQPEYRLRFGEGGNFRPGQNPWEWNFVDAVLAPGSIVACLKDWEAVDVIESPSSYVSLAIVNYLKAASQQPAPDERTYTPTGYFLPITDGMLASLPTDTDASGAITAFVLNGAEVYGGDTYVNLVDFARLVPLWNDGCERRNSYTPDYGVGHIVPLESKFNYALRQGRSLANNGFYSQEAACENRFLHATGGIALDQPEEWNLNDVLTPKELVALYKPLPSTVKITDDKYASIHSSQPKVYGERDDSYRQWRPLDYTDLDGTKGPITRLESILNGIYVFQERDYGRLRARDRAIVPTSVGELTTGTGKNLDGVDYTGQEVGLHEFAGLVKGTGCLYWLDTERKLLCRFSQAGRDELSDREHTHDLFTITLPDRDVAGLALGVDNRHGDVWITYGRLLTSQTRTILYNEKLDVFVNDQTDCQPLRYCSWRGKLYGVSRDTPHRTDRLASGPLGVYFDKAYTAELGWIANPEPLYPKTFDNLAITVVGHEALTQIDLTTATDHQLVDLRVGNDPRVSWRNGRIVLPLMNRIPRNGRADPRLRDHYLHLLLSIDPQRLTPGHRFTLTATELLYRLAPRV